MSRWSDREEENEWALRIARNALCALGVLAALAWVAALAAGK
jgi:hypothetical protein